MPLIKLDNAQLAYGHHALLDHVEMQIDPGERVCLIGRNGSGKSSLMRLFVGEATLDDGLMWKEPGLRLAHLTQEVPEDEHRATYDVVADGLDGVGQILSAYHHVLDQMAINETDELIDEMTRLQQLIEDKQGWHLDQRVNTVLSKLDLDPHKTMTELSGGYKRRVMLARALVSEPELLLLDEPTNHLDIESITWMEEFLKSFGGSLLFITHDRSFLKNLANRIIELDRGKLTSWPGNYEQYLVKKAEWLAIETQQNARFDKMLSQEETWIRQGIKARRTRNEGRVRALEQLRRERGQRREQTGKVSMTLAKGEKSGKQVIVAENMSKAYDGKTIIKDFSTTIIRGDRIGIIGPNGVGKSTLLKLMLAEITPDQGKCTLGTKINTAYFDQQRAVLDPEKTVAENINPYGDTVTINGRSQHVIGYLKSFLFPPQRVNSPVKTLSGGERNRLLLAQLFTKDANLLVMDEPTNDLDVETLELLEELLCNFDGTLIVVSHDRSFLDNVVTSTIVYEGDGQFNEYVGGYDDWLRQRRTTTRLSSTLNSAPASSTPKIEAVKEKVAAAPAVKPKAKKLSYKEQRELDALPEQIEELENEQVAVEATINDPEFYKTEQDEMQATLKRLDSIAEELDECYQRWGTLGG